MKVCYTGALQASGKWYAVDELMRVFNRDRCYWGPQGGVTLTGGEPLMQEEFVLDLLEQCQQDHVDTCVETSAYVPRSVLRAALPYIQWLFVDLKHMDLQSTGSDRRTERMILENIRWIASSGWPGKMVLRMPVIPGFNDESPMLRRLLRSWMRSARAKSTCCPFIDWEPQSTSNSG